MADPQYIPVSTGSTRSGIVSSTISSTASGQSYTPEKYYDWNNADEVRSYDKWANLYTGYDKDFGLNSYYDYFFTGQDIQVQIDGLTDSQDVLPIYQFGYSIQQNKQPLYGFWSYTYDYMLRGNRIVSGAFSILTKYPGFMTEKVAKAASVRSNRSKNASLYPVRGLNEDESNIEAYWRRNYDSNLDANQKHLFSIHPPFNLIIIYGVQDTSLSLTTGDQRAEEIRRKYYSSTAMMTDINERLVESDPDDASMRVLIENVELLSRQTEYTPEGDPVMETYSFMARDIREAPTPRVGTMAIPGDRGSSGGSGPVKYR